MYMNYVGLCLNTEVLKEFVIMRRFSGVVKYKKLPDTDCHGPDNKRNYPTRTVTDRPENRDPTTRAARLSRHVTNQQHFPHKQTRTVTSRVPTATNCHDTNRNDTRHP